MQCHEHMSAPELQHVDTKELTEKAQSLVETQANVMVGFRQRKFKPASVSVLARDDVDG